MTIQDQITYSEVQLERCQSTLKMFQDKFFGKVRNTDFTLERQLHIIDSWTKAVNDHTNTINELKAKLS